jgi:hypothetical protein
MDEFRKKLILVMKVVAVELVIAAVFLIFGFRITYAPELETSWSAVSAVGQWVGAFAALLIPVAVVYIEKSMDDNRATIGEANSDLLIEMEKFKNEYYEKIRILTDLVDDEGNIVIDGGTFTDDIQNEVSQEDLKEKALKFVNISMMTKTDRVAEHLNVSKEKAFEILVELLRHDGLIDAGGQVRIDNIDNILWTKRTSHIMHRRNK